MRDFLMLPHLLTNFKIQKHYQHKQKFTCVSARNNLPKVKNEAYDLKFDWDKSIGA